MGTFFVYILKSSVCLAVFYLFYRLLLSRETFHRFNRFGLLGLLVLSCLVPLMEVTVHQPLEVAQPVLLLEEMLMVPDAGMDVAEESVSFPWRALLLWVYGAGILFFVIRHLWSFVRMLRLLHRCTKKRLPDGTMLFVHQEKTAPFSWMKNIVISGEDLEENGETILKHEYAHIRNGHSWDLLLAEVCIFFQWFNPAAWLLKQELQNIHEFEADEWVIKCGIDAKTYQILLIKKAVGARLYSIANSLNHSSLKKRITMMIKKKSNPWARMKYLYVLPLAAVTVAAFARPEVSNELNEISSAKVNDLTSIVKAEEVKSVENQSEEKFKLSGQVVEYPSHKPVAGASVLIKGTTVGTLTDYDGRFQLPVKEGDVLVFSFIGLNTTSVIVEKGMNDKNTKLTVHMREEVQSLDEMVVVGYGAQEEKPAEPTVTQKDESGEEVIFQVVEEMPQFPGGMSECMKFLARNIKYPVAAQQAKIEGRVIVQFVVSKDGSVSNVEIMRGVSEELDAEAIRVVKMMPNWTPGKQRGKAVSVKYTMPIMFRLDKPAPKEEAKIENAGPLMINLKVDKDADMDNVNLAKNHLRTHFGGAAVADVNGKTPLIVVDGKVKGKGSKYMAEISPEQVESITVLKGEAAQTVYGEDAKDGVILVTTKK